ncbi:hypothetical protein [Pararhodobacter zhoushanensis]|uniref:hypothetical protein n=1 Tax=Pararhodobacter zhoushanensis TaxID=2479545 RepID=UPI000F8C61CB|nr:hypothetical protein [Pararhodobacter zhoushanensis]
MSTAAVALFLPMTAGVALAQSSGFAIEIGPGTDPYSSTRIGARVFGTATDPAASFVRGCQGAMIPEASGAAFEVTDRMETLAFTAAGEGLRSLVVGSPNGLYQCALADDEGFVSTQLAGVAPGRYTVWLGGEEGSTIDARLFASERAVSAMELFGLNVARLGEPRAGRFVFAASAETGRQDLVQDGVLYANTEMRPLAPESCWGYSQFDAADAVLTLDEDGDDFSIFAMSDRDLVMAVVDPSGQVHCNDDVYQLNPGVTLTGAAGDYQIFVGGYGQGGDGSTYDLYTSVGAPAFSNAIVDLDGAPRAGTISFDLSDAGQGQLLATGPVHAFDPVNLLPMSSDCRGYTDLSAPDLVMTLDAAEPMISLYARSETDLVMAVRAPDGSWSCNDDSFELNPGLSFTDAQPGEYLVYVGAYMSDVTGEYNLYASMGSPNWGGAVPAGGSMAPDSLNVTAEPTVGTLSFGPDTLLDPRIIFDIEASTTEAFGMGTGCAGFISPSQPDLVIDAQSGLPQLMIYMVGDVDSTLAVVGPDGQIYCNDDFEQLNPGVMIPNPQPGPYAVFAGSYGGDGGLATLGVTIASPQWVMDREH